MLIDCETCTVRGHGCDDCVVTVLLGAPPGWRGSDPTVVPLTRRRPAAEAAPTEVAQERVARTVVAQTGVVGSAVAADAPGSTDAGRDVARVDESAVDPWSLVELDEVEQQAVRALAEFGLVPPLRHQDASTRGSRHVS